MKRHLFVAGFALVAFTAAGCQTPEKLTGTRLSVFDLEKKLRVADKQVRAVSLPKARINRDWTQIGMVPSNRAAHLALGKNVKEVRRLLIGDGSSVPFAWTPLVAQGKIFVVDGQNTISAFDLKTGWQLWQQSFYRDNAFGATLAYDKGRLFVATGGGSLAALAVANGDILWREETGLAYRAAPVVWQGKVFFMSFNNQLSVRDVFSGKEVWKHAGISEPSSLLMHTAVAIGGGVVIVPYNSGEVFALRAGSGEFIWTDNLLRQGLNVGTNNAGFIAAPVIEGNRVYMISNGDFLAALDRRTGKRVWSQHISGMNMPWLAGSAVYVVSQTGVLLGLDKNSGAALWRVGLPGSNTWYGPVLAGGLLWLTSADGLLAQVAPQTGKVVRVQKLAEGFNTSPVVASQRLFLLSTKQELIEMRGQ